MTRLSERCVEESWEEVHVRLHRVAVELQDMLDQLNSRRRPPEFRRQERELKVDLRLALRWIGLALRTPLPETAEDAEEFVLCLYELDELRPQLDDDFHRLMEATGEDVFLA
jgi:hypothetical protein